MQYMGMDFLPDIDTLTTWLTHYGPPSLFILLALGIIALPVPEETLLVTSGVLMKNGQLDEFNTIIAAICGSMLGITTSYLIGRTTSKFVIHRYGSWIGITEERLNQAHAWFEKYGKWSLFIGYFIPGVRHFTGLFAGFTELQFSHFALYAYSGAIVWVSLFLTVGYTVGHYLPVIYENIEIIVEVTLGTLLLAGIVYLIVRKKEK